ncbi:MAG: methyltransferase [Anaerolineae bacterium]|nr:methyltransferase [Anaerolineae bacterium]
MTDYLDVTETNKLIRKQLERLWPSVKFSVRKTSHSAVDVYWQDGPAIHAVEHVLDAFKGQEPADNTDYCAPRIGTHPDTGKAVHFGTNYIQVHRTYSKPVYTALVTQVCERYGEPVPEIKTHENGDAYFNVGWHRVGKTDHDLHTLVWQASLDYDVLANPTPAKPAATPSGATATKVAGGWQVRGTRFEDRETFQQFKESLGFRWNKDNKKDRFWWCPVDELPAEVLALVNAPETPASPASPPAQPAENAQDYARIRANELRRKAESLTPRIEAKENPAIGQQRPTHRRAGIAAGMWQEGQRLRRTQAILNNLADAWLDDTIVQWHRQIRNIVDVDTFLDYPELPQATSDAYKRVSSMGLGTQYAYNTARQALLKLDTAPINTEAEALREAERDLIGRKIDGYFPTPAAVVNTLLDQAAIGHNHRVLEPSAGSGHIADLIRDQHPYTACLHCVEPVQRLRKVLELKGHKLVAYNIYSYQVARDEMYDRIVMNPPFEHNQDIEHVQYVFEQFLKPGGRLVAIVSEHTRIGSEKAVREFQQWLDTWNATDEPLPDGAFLNGDRPTGVRTRMIVVDKPEEGDYWTRLQTATTPLPLTPEESYRQALINGDLDALKTAAQAMRDSFTVQMDSAASDTESEV